MNYIYIYRFASSLYHPSSKYYDRRPRNENDENKQETAGSMDVDSSNQKQIKQSPYINAYVIKAPSQRIIRDNKQVYINYPYPCQIVAGKSWDNGRILGVIYAVPNDDLKVKIEISNLERDPVKVSKLEQEFISVCNLGGDNPLGYKSIIDQQWQ